MNLICACCGGIAPAKKQWFNQDTGYGICARCFTRNIEHERTVLHNEDAEAQLIRSYGKPGIHHSLTTQKPEPDTEHLDALNRHFERMTAQVMAKALGESVIVSREDRLLGKITEALWALDNHACSKAKQALEEALQIK